MLCVVILNVVAPFEKEKRSGRVNAGATDINIDKIFVICCQYVDDNIKVCLCLTK